MYEESKNLLLATSVSDNGMYLLGLKLVVTVACSELCSMLQVGGRISSRSRQQELLR